MTDLMAQAKRIHRTVVAALVLAAGALGFEAIRSFPGHTTKATTHSHTSSTSNSTAPFVSSGSSGGSSPSTSSGSSAPTVSQAPSAATPTPTGGS